MSFTNYSNLAYIRSDHSWSLASEKTAVQQIALAIDKGLDEWSCKARFRHGTGANFIRSYIQTLGVRFRSFDGQSSMGDNERRTMRLWCMGLLEEMSKPSTKPKPIKPEPEIKPEPDVQNCPACNRPLIYSADDPVEGPLGHCVECQKPFADGELDEGLISLDGIVPTEGNG